MTTPFSGTSSGYGSVSIVRSFPFTGNPEGTSLKIRPLFCGILSCICSRKSKKSIYIQCLNEKGLWRSNKYLSHLKFSTADSTTSEYRRFVIVRAT